MSDTRFIILGIALIFGGFLVLGVFGEDYRAANIEIREFGDCYKYSDNNEPTPINCSYKAFDQTIFFGTVIVLIAVGVISLIKGIRGKWDNEVKPEDMVGPGKDQDTEKED